MAQPNQNDLDLWQTDISAHAVKLKDLLADTAQLKDYFDDLGLAAALGVTINAKDPLVNADLTSYDVNILTKFLDFADSVGVAALDRRTTIERVATTPTT